MASIARRPDGTYRPRFRDASGKEHARHFKRKVDAQRWLDEMTAAMVTGQYVDPAAGRVTFREYAERWRASQVHRPTTAAHVETMLRRHVYPGIGRQAAWHRCCPATSSPSSSSCPWTSHQRPWGWSTGSSRGSSRPPSATAGSSPRRARAPSCRRSTGNASNRMTLEAVEALTEAMPERYRALVTLAAGTGLRQGEMLRSHRRTASTSCAGSSPSTGS